MALCRERQGLYSTLDEVKELQKILKWCMYQLEKAEREELQSMPSLEERAESSHALIVARSKIDREARERSHLERCVGRPSGNPARLQSECRVIRPATEVADRVLAELAAQGPSPEVEEESTPVIEESAPTRNGNYSRKRIGECGQRIGFNIDRVLREIRGPVFEDESLWPDDNADELKLHRSLDALLEAIKTESLVVPRLEVAPLVGADDEVLPVVVEEVAGAASTITAEPSPFDGDSAWSLLCAVPDFSPCDLEELASALDQHSELQGIALVAAITRAKLTLSGISSWTKPDEPIEIGAGDLLVLLRSALRGVK